jgi:hypothetical protein
MDGIHSSASSSTGVREGDIIRFELEEDGMWFYCRVRELNDSGEVLFSVVDAQSWPNVALCGYLPGREYRLPVARILSVVRPAADARTGT